MNYASWSHSRSHSKIEISFLILSRSFAYPGPHFEGGFSSFTRASLIFLAFLLSNLLRTSACALLVALTKCLPVKNWSCSSSKTLWFMERSSSSLLRRIQFRKFLLLIFLFLRFFLLFQVDFIDSPFKKNYFSGG